MKLKPFINSLYSTYVLILFFLPFPLIFVIFILTILVKDRQRNKIISQVLWVWGQFWELFSGITFDVKGRENFHKQNAAVIISNHSNLLDIFIVGAYFQFYWKALAKKEFFSVPLMNVVFKAVCIPVDRKNPESRKQSIKLMSNALNEGISILVFPEGSRNRTTEPLTSFRNGAFRIAISNNVPIVPVVVTGTRKLQPVGTWRFYPGKGKVYVLDPIDISPFANEEELREHMYQLMYGELIKKDPSFRGAEPKTVDSIKK